MRRTLARWTSIATAGAPAEAALFVTPHHPDQLRRPTAIATPPVEASLTWNVFRTLEQLPPALWLRRLNARLGLEVPAPAPSIVRVRLWGRLPAPAAARLLGAPADAAVDVLIETEHAVWALLARHQRDIDAGVVDRVCADPLVRLGHAASERAGRRAAYVGLVISSAASAPFGAALIGRYGLAPGAAAARAPGRQAEAAMANVRGFGLGSWTDLAALLDDCVDSGGLDDIQVRLAKRTRAWLSRVRG